MEKYYDVAEIAELFHKKHDTIRKKIARGDFGETLNDGRAHLVSEAGLKAYIEARTGPAHYERTLIHKPYKRMSADCMARL